MENRTWRRIITYYYMYFIWRFSKYFITINSIHVTSRRYHIRLQTIVHYECHYAKGCYFNTPLMNLFCVTLYGQTKQVLRISRFTHGGNNSQKSFCRMLSEYQGRSGLCVVGNRALSLPELEPQQSSATPSVYTKRYENLLYSPYTESWIGAETYGCTEYCPVILRNFSIWTVTVRCGGTVTLVAYVHKEWNKLICSIWSAPVWTIYDIIHCFLLIFKIMYIHNMHICIYNITHKWMRQYKAYNSGCITCYWGGSVQRCLIIDAYETNIRHRCMEIMYSAF